jgi:hypothetical protein
MNKSKTENLEICRSVRREMGRHSVNFGDVQVSATFGVIRFHGRVRPLRGHEATFDADIAGFLKALRQRAGIRDVVAEWTIVL